MTKIAFCADIHVGNHKNGIKHGGEITAGLNVRCQQVLTVLKGAKDKANELEVDAFVVAGDLFDTARPLPQMIRAVQEILEDIPAVLLIGNHDRVSDANGDHALGPLLPVAEVVEHATVIRIGDVDLGCMPYKPGNAREWFDDETMILRSQYSKEEGRVRLLTLHLGIEDDDTEHFLKGAHDAIDRTVVEEAMEHMGLTYVFAGNWHDHRHWYVDDGLKGICQCGTLAPTGWDNSGDDGYGLLCVFDTEKRPLVSFHEIPGPRFLTVNGARAADSLLEPATKKGNAVHVRWEANIDEMQEAQEEIDEWVAAGIVVAGNVDPFDDKSEEAARTAAKVARKAETLGEALAKFVEEMPLEEGIDRAEVLSRAQTYLGGA